MTTLKELWHMAEVYEHHDISPMLTQRMREIASQLRKMPTPSEAILWDALRRKQLDGRKFRRQISIGSFVVDFYCWTEKLVVEVDGSIHELQRGADAERQELIESLGIRFIRVSAAHVETDLISVLSCIRAAFNTPI
jgi:very-short-patch-repair endonuclease